MKLESHNVQRFIIDQLVRDENLHGEERRDNLPVIAIEGVPCAIDTNEAVVQTGEGKEQRWFKIYLSDVTPRRFLPVEEQLAEDEVDDWWMVTSSVRTAFVKAKSRSLAIERFNCKFPGEKACMMDEPDAELTQGFEFIEG